MSRNDLLFVSKSIQPPYSPKAHYPPIRKKYSFHKCLNSSSLYESQDWCNGFNGRSQTFADLTCRPFTTDLLTVRSVRTPGSTLHADLPQVVPTIRSPTLDSQLDAGLVGPLIQHTDLQVVLTCRGVRWNNNGTVEQIVAGQP